MEKGNVTPGTDMTVAELKMYFTVNIVKSTFPVPRYWKMVWPFFWAVISKQSDTEVGKWVVKMESNGYDVPTKAQAEAAGMLNPLA